MLYNFPLIHKNKYVLNICGVKKNICNTLNINFYLLSNFKFNINV